VQPPVRASQKAPQSGCCKFVACIVKVLSYARGAALLGSVYCYWYLELAKKENPETLSLAGKNSITYPSKDQHAKSGLKLCMRSAHWVASIGRLSKPVPIGHVTINKKFESQCSV